MGDVATLLGNTLSPVAETRRAAEKTLDQMTAQPGFAVQMLGLLEAQNAPPGVQQAGSVYFKNLVKRYWDDDPNGVLAPTEREQIKNNLLTLMCQVNRQVQAQLGESIRIIGKSDFPNNWKTLLPDLTQKLGATEDFTIIIGLLETANTLFKMFRDEKASDELFLKLKYCLEEFQKPLLVFFKSCMGMIEPNGSNPAMLTNIFTALRLLTRIWYSLNWQELPEFFEDHMTEWMQEFHKLLVFESKALESDDDEQPGKVELVQQAVIENLKLYFTKYEEDFAQHVQQFAITTWHLLNKTPMLARYDGLVTSALQFLAQLIGNVRQKQLFAQQSTLQEIIEKIVVPNLRLRESDYETFEDNPIEYIRRDIEGSDSETRRRMACDLVRAMCRHFDQETTKLCETVVTALVNEYRSNPSQNWYQMDTAITLMLAVAVRRHSLVGGVSEVNPNINVNEFFSQLILPELTSSNVDSQPVVKADVIKFFATFRNQMPKEMVVQILPQLVALLKASSFVVHTYAAQAIDRIFMIREQPQAGATTTPSSRRKFVYTAEDLTPVLAPAMTNLFAILESYEGGFENEYVAKAVMRIITKAQPATIAQATDGVLDKLNTVLGRVCANPQNPKFIHFLCESIAALIRSACSVNPQYAEEFEKRLMPPFQVVLQQEISELTPYVFQILAQLLELRPSKISQGYLSLFPPLLHPDNWRNVGNHPALVRLLEAYMRKAAAETVGANPKQLEGMLGIFHLLLSQKSTVDIAFRLLIGIVEFLPPEAYRGYLPKIFELSFTALRQSNSKDFALSLTNFISVMVGKHGVQDVQQGMQSLGGLNFNDYLANVWVPSSKAIKGVTDRKACAVALTRVVVEAPELRTPPLSTSLWPNVFVAVLHIFEAPAPTVDLESQEEQLDQISETGYASSFSKLVHGQTEIRDSFKEIENPKLFFVRKIAEASQATPNVFPNLIQNALNGKPNFATCFQNITQEAQVNIV
ncbi:Exportin-2 [Hondaea fermentalgiana]|uniref:Exportin-2 n=1 Tax=Hondaea fermentalgiana TaxID=2315210 RepID=A0A2R5GFY4_9STRA|nr:Exportin-2 [Hondaea fermentalgiana]|eukprot:GBG29239.1 Exportin-2 [Hondaea fermentalgiana]